MDELSRYVAHSLEVLPYHVDSKPIAVLERGYKVRIVSCSDAVRTARSEAYRSVLFKRLERIDACQLSLLGEPVEISFEVRSVPADELFVYSADLKAATDNLSWDAIASFCRGAEVPFDLVAGGTLDHKPMSRGTLMGIPCSWPVLSAIHCWAVLYMKIPKGSFHIKGDDLIGLWTKEEIIRYERDLSTFTGMLLNPKKTFTFPMEGWFCERHFTREGFLLKLSPTVMSLKPLTAPQEPRGYPFELALTSYLWSLADRVDWSTLRRIQKVLVESRLPKLHLAMGEWKFMPITLGGLNLLPNKKFQRTSQRLSGMLTAIHDGRGSHIVRKLGQVQMYLYPKGSSHRFVAKFMAERMEDWGVHFKVDHPDPYPGAFVRKYRAVVANVQAFMTLKDGGFENEKMAYLSYLAMSRKKTKVILSGLQLPQTPKHHKVDRRWSFYGAQRLLARLSVAGFTFPNQSTDERKSDVAWVRQHLFEMESEPRHHLSGAVQAFWVPVPHGHSL